MKKNILVGVFCILAAAVSVSAQKDLCFENDGLKVKQIVRMIIINNKKIEGTFESGGGDETSSMETFNFTGTKTGSLLTIIFDSGKPPYEVAKGTKRIVWTLGAKALKIPIYGKNYDTNKYSTYSASFDKCTNN